MDLAGLLLKQPNLKLGTKSIKKDRRAEDSPSNSSWTAHISMETYLALEEDQRLPTTTSKKPIKPYWMTAKNNTNTKKVLIYNADTISSSLLMLTSRSQTMDVLLTILTSNISTS